MKQLRRNQSKLFVALLVTVAFAVSCAAPTLNVKTPKQQAIVWMDVYNAQYDDTMAIMTSPNATESQKAVGRKKKEILVKVWPLLKIYVDTVENNGVPSDAAGQEITELINQLTAMATRGH